MTLYQGIWPDCFGYVIHWYLDTHTHTLTDIYTTSFMGMFCEETVVVIQKNIQGQHITYVVYWLLYNARLKKELANAHFFAILRFDEYGYHFSIFTNIYVTHFLLHEWNRKFRIWGIHVLWCDDHAYSFKKHTHFPL